jgi:hypothetical protein
MTTTSSSMAHRSNGKKFDLARLSSFLRKRIDSTSLFPTLAPVKMKITSKLESTSAPVAVRLNSYPHADMWVDRPHGGWGESS